MFKGLGRLSNKKDWILNGFDGYLVLKQWIEWGKKKQRNLHFLSNHTKEEKAIHPKNLK